MTGASWGSDPLVRWLRALAVVAFIAILCVVALDPDKASNGTLLILLMGGILTALGYPVVMNLPALFGPKNGKDEPRPRPKDEP